jgi:hypothetical protein
MTDSLERFLEDLRLEPSPGLVQRAKQAAAAQAHEIADQQIKRITPNVRVQPHLGRQPKSELLALVAALLAFAIVATIVFTAWSHRSSLIPSKSIPNPLVPRDPIPPSIAANGWIAYSTDRQPAPGHTSANAHTDGSDIYLVRAGVAPRLIASREGGKIWNVCPAFSPDGLRLAYGVDAEERRSVIVDGVDGNGSITATIRLPVPGVGLAVCPRWSSDGTHVGYLDGSVVVRGLDGSTLAAGPGDPKITDFTQPSTLLSPQGDRIAWLECNQQGGVVEVAPPPDRLGAHAIPLTTGCPYALPTWSPDGHQVLVMQDVSGIDFTMLAVGVDSPYEVDTIVSFVHRNSSRDWPGWGDVSWQPLLTPRPA